MKYTLCVFVFMVSLVSNADNPNYSGYGIVDPHTGRTIFAECLQTGHPNDHCIKMDVWLQNFGIQRFKKHEAKNGFNEKLNHGGGAASPLYSGFSDQDSMQGYNNVIKVINGNKDNDLKNDRDPLAITKKAFAQEGPVGTDNVGLISWAVPSGFTILVTGIIGIDLRVNINEGAPLWSETQNNKFGWSCVGLGSAIVSVPLITLFADMFGDLANQVKRTKISRHYNDLEEEMLSAWNAIFDGGSIEELDATKMTRVSGDIIDLIVKTVKTYKASSDLENEINEYLPGFQPVINYYQKD